MAGFAVAVQQRLTSAERAARAAAEPTVASGPSVALVLADRSARVDEHLASVYPRLRSARGRQLSGSGGHAGYDAGQRADLGTNNRVSPAANRPALS
jgi:hypothetical protein